MKKDEKYRDIVTTLYLGGFVIGWTLGVVVGAIWF